MDVLEGRSRREVGFSLQRNLDSQSRLTTDNHVHWSAYALEKQKNFDQVEYDLESWLESVVGQ